MVDLLALAYIAGGLAVGHVWGRWRRGMTEANRRTLAQGERIVAELVVIRRLLERRAGDDPRPPPA